MPEATACYSCRISDKYQDTIGLLAGGEPPQDLPRLEVDHRHHVGVGVGNEGQTTLGLDQNPYRYRSSSKAPKESLLREVLCNPLSLFERL